MRSFDQIARFTRELRHGADVEMGTSKKDEKFGCVHKGMALSVCKVIQSTKFRAPFAPTKQILISESNLHLYSDIAVSKSGWDWERKNELYSGVTYNRHFDCITMTTGENTVK